MYRKETALKRNFQKLRESPGVRYESVYAELLAGRGMFLCPMIYPAFPAGWHIPLHLSLPDTRLLTLRDDPRPEICTLRKVFAEVYAEREKLIKAL